ncbi:hypothetical protein ERJ75_001237200 [Trypanosoma vivax]|uniref:BAR domain-containing protein n=1 Tax=Trypanosoma vivax (strain Y486) TaxID=1055687 RepID=F9WSC9_TRYVY|nr:hypothetical protein ERJ75_001237200 [Trypanosoma vivax]CCD20468.1 hypothetical protein TvY486_0033020 [Trypanosoma vivax Y486]|eukprot:CCD20468.1 hypothetical protein TvY486_0033020 [Trypanosoma vivax Y486]
MLKRIKKSSCGDLEQRLKNVKEIRKRLQVLEGSFKKMIMSSSDMASALEFVASSYANITASTRVHRAWEDGTPSSALGATATSRLALSGDGLAPFEVACIFSCDMREMKDSNTLSDLRSDFCRCLIPKITPLHESARVTEAAAKAACSAVQDYKHKSSIVENKLLKYARSNKEVSASKRLPQQEMDCSNAKTVMEAKVRHFKELYENLMISIEVAADETIRDFIEIICTFLESLVAKLRRVSANPSSRTMRLADIYPSVMRDGPKDTREPFGNPPTRTLRMTRASDVGTVTKGTYASVSTRYGVTQNGDYATPRTSRFGKTAGPPRDNTKLMQNFAYVEQGNDARCVESRKADQVSTSSLRPAATRTRPATGTDLHSPTPSKSRMWR